MASKCPSGKTRRKSTDGKYRCVKKCKTKPRQKRSAAGRCVSARKKKSAPKKKTAPKKTAPKKKTAKKADCKDGKYRNKSTGRCRMTNAQKLQACHSKRKPGNNNEYLIRNGRCMQKCSKQQKRSKSTGRCISRGARTKSGALKPKRPDCRKQSYAYKVRVNRKSRTTFTHCDKKGVKYWYVFTPTKNGKGKYVKQPSAPAGVPVGALGAGASASTGAPAPAGASADDSDDEVSEDDAVPASASWPNPGSKPWEHCKSKMQHGTKVTNTKKSGKSFVHCDKKGNLFLYTWEPGAKSPTKSARPINPEDYTKYYPYAK